MSFKFTKVYICHPFSGDPQANVESVRGICRGIVELNKQSSYGSSSCISTSDVHHFIPFAPHLLFPEFMSEETLGRELAMEYCFSLLLSCDQIWVYHGTQYGVTSGMREEISLAADLGIEIVWKE